VLNTTDNGATWAAQNSTVGVRLWSVDAADDSTAYAVGDGGTIVYTHNGGATWTVAASGTAMMLRGIDASNPTNVVAVGRNGTIVRSTNGGTSWASVVGPDMVSTLISVAFSDANTGIAATRYNYVWRTTDGGATWASISSASWVIQTDVRAQDATTFVMSGGWGVLMRSTDGGLTWSRLLSGTTADFFYGVSPVDTNTVYSAGESNDTARTTPSVVGAAQVSDYGAGPSNWAGSGNSNLFGVCLQATPGATVNGPTWTVDGNGTCIASDSDPWQAIPTSPSKVASTSGAGVTGRIDLVWGMRVASNQKPGSYSATIVIEALAPNV